MIRLAPNLGQLPIRYAQSHIRQRNNQPKIGLVRSAKLVFTHWCENTVSRFQWATVTRVNRTTIDTDTLTHAHHMTA